MAYASKYYDPAKAHEYYLKRRQLKGRTQKASTSDLSDSGKVAAQEVKARLQEELKAALKKIKKGNTAARAKLRAEYREKYLKELEEIRKDESMVKQKKQKKSSNKGAKSSGSKTSGRNTQPKAENANKGQNSKKVTYADIQKAISKAVNKKLEEITQRLPNMNEQEKADLKEQLTGMIKRLMAYK
jgi:hypothetical protein